MSENMKNHENNPKLLFLAIFFTQNVYLLGKMGNNVKLDKFLMKNNWNKNK